MEPVSDKEFEIEIHPEEAFCEVVNRAINSYYKKQSELLRLSRFVGEKEEEIDDPLERAMQIIDSKISGAPCDKLAVSSLIEIMSVEFSHDEIAIEENSEAEESDRFDRFIRKFQKAADGVPPELLPTYFESVMEVVTAPHGAPLLRSSLLVSLAGDFEVLISELIRACYSLSPDRLNESDKKFSLAEIGQFADLDEIREYMAERAVSDVLRGSFDDWIQFFIKKFGVAEPPEAKDFDVQELMQRRHCIVHNSGQVSRIYLEKLKKFRVVADVGDSLPVSHEYLKKSADSLFLVAYSLCWDLRHKLLKSEEFREASLSVLVEYTMQLLVDARFDVARKIGDQIKDITADDSTGLIVQVNRWLAYKFLGEFDLVREEVENLDVRGKSRLFNLAKHALLDEPGEAAEVANALLQDGTLTLHNVFTWPLLRDVRGRVETKVVGS